MFVPRSQNPPVAIALMLTATVFIAGTTLLAKALGTDALGPALHPLQISHGRFLFAFLGFSAAFTVLRPPLRSRNLRLHLMRSSLGWLGVTLLFASVAFIPLADATAISFLNPVFAMILAVPLLGETVGRIRWTAAVVAMLGALILLRPGPESFQPAALLALAAAVVLGVEIICIKRLSGREGPLQILFINNAFGMAISSVAVMAVWAPPSPTQWLALIALGAMMMAAQACFVNSLARADSSLVAPFTYATLVFAAFYDLAIFGVVPDAISGLGAAIIVTGAAVLAWREARLARKTA